MLCNIGVAESLLVSTFLYVLPECGTNSSGHGWAVEGKKRWQSRLVVGL